MKDHRTTTRVRPNRLLMRQEGSYSGGEYWTERENRALVAAGFEPPPYEEDDMWSKDGVLFGRSAALQNSGQRPLASR
jgi:hypothetical protein